MLTQPPPGLQCILLVSSLLLYHISWGLTTNCSWSTDAWSPRPVLAGCFISLESGADLAALERSPFDPAEWIPPELRLPGTWPQSLRLADLTFQLASCAPLWTVSEKACTFRDSSKWPSPGLQAGPSSLFFRQLVTLTSTAERLNLTCPLDDWRALLAARGGVGAAHGNGTATSAGLAPCGTATVTSGQQLVQALEALQPGHARLLITLAANISLPADPTPQRELNPPDDTQPLVRIYRNVTLAGAALADISAGINDDDGTRVGPATEIDYRKHRNPFGISEPQQGQSDQQRAVLVLADLTLTNTAPGPPHTWPLGLLTMLQSYAWVNRSITTGPQLIGLRTTIVYSPGQLRYMGYWYSRLISLSAVERQEAAWLRPLLVPLQAITDADGSVSTRGRMGNFSLTFNVTATPVPLLTPTINDDFDLWSLETPAIAADGSAVSASGTAANQQPQQAPLPPGSFAVAANASQLLKLLQEQWSGGPRVILVIANVTLRSGEWPQGGAALSYNVSLVGPVAGAPVWLDTGGIPLAKAVTYSKTSPTNTSSAAQQQQPSLVIQLHRLRLLGFAPPLLEATEADIMKAETVGAFIAATSELVDWRHSCLQKETAKGSSETPLLRYDLRNCFLLMPKALVELMWLFNAEGACGSYISAATAASSATAAASHALCDLQGGDASSATALHLPASLQEMLSTVLSVAPPTAAAQLLPFSGSSDLESVAANSSTAAGSLVSATLRDGAIWLSRCVIVPVESVAAASAASSSAQAAAAAGGAGNTVAATGGESSLCGVESFLLALRSLVGTAPGPPPSPPPPPAAIAGAGSGSGDAAGGAPSAPSHTAAIVGGTVGASAALLLLCASAATVALMLRRRRHHGPSSTQQEGKGASLFTMELPLAAADAPCAEHTDGQGPAVAIRLTGLLTTEESRRTRDRQDQQQEALTAGGVATIDLGTSGTYGGGEGGQHVGFSISFVQQQEAARAGGGSVASGPETMADMMLKPVGAAATGATGGRRDASRPRWGQQLVPSSLDTADGSGGLPSPSLGTAGASSNLHTTVAEEIESMLRKCKATFTEVAASSSGGGMKRRRRPLLLGRGAFGAVYLGTWRGLPAAIKVLVLSAADPEERRARVVREAALTSTLSHPNIVPTYHYEIKAVRADDDGAAAAAPEIWGLMGDDPTGDDNGADIAALRLQLVMQYCEGGTLQAALREGKFGAPYTPYGPSPHSQQPQKHQQLPRLSQLYCGAVTSRDGAAAGSGGGGNSGRQQAPTVAAGSPAASAAVAPLRVEPDSVPIFPVETGHQPLAAIKASPTMQTGRRLEWGDLAPASNMPLSLLAAHDVLRGLDYLHSHGVIHGDLTDNNVLLKAVQPVMPSKPSQPPWGSRLRPASSSAITPPPRPPTQPPAPPHPSAKAPAAGDPASGASARAPAGNYHSPCAAACTAAAATSSSAMAQPPAAAVVSSVSPFFARDADGNAATAAMSQGTGSTDLVGPTAEAGRQQQAGLAGGLPAGTERASVGCVSVGLSAGSGGMTVTLERVLRAEGWMAAAAAGLAPKSPAVQQQQQQQADPPVVQRHVLLQTAKDCTPPQHQQQHLQLQHLHNNGPPAPDAQTPPMNQLPNRHCFSEATSGPLADSQVIAPAVAAAVAAARSAAAMPELYDAANSTRGGSLPGVAAAAPALPQASRASTGSTGNSPQPQWNNPPANAVSSATTLRWTTGQPSSQSRRMACMTEESSGLSAEATGVFVLGCSTSDQRLTTADGPSTSLSSPLLGCAGMVQMATHLLSWSFKLSDFGLSMQMHGDSQKSHLSNVAQGTPFFTAPEVVNLGRLSPAADVYSFGVLLWLLLHGVSLMQLRHLLPRIPHVPIGPMLLRHASPGLPPAARELLQRCLEHQPSQRPTAGQLLASVEALLRAVAGSELSQVLLSLERKEHVIPSAAAAGAELSRTQSIGAAANAAFR